MGALVLAVAVQAAVPAQAGSVTDLTGRLKRDAVRWAEANCELFQSRTQVRLALLVTPHAGTSGIGELVRQAHASWSLGERGLLVVLATASHELDFHAGAAVAGRFPREPTLALLRRAANVALRADDSSGAVMASVAAILSSLGVHPVDTVFGPQAMPKKPRKRAPLLTLAAVVLFLAGLIAIDPDWRALAWRSLRLRT